MNPERDEDWIALSEPDIDEVESEVVRAALRAPRLSEGPFAERFEAAFAQWTGRAHAVSVASGTLGALLALRALGIGPGDEVIVSAYGWHQIAHAVAWVGATPVCAEINYWTGCMNPARAAQHIGPRTRAIMAGNVNGHPAEWQALRELADSTGVALIEDSTEAIGSRYAGRRTGSFGDLAVFDFSQPSALCVGEGGMVLTDDADMAAELRMLRRRDRGDRQSISAGSRVPLQAAMSELAAALGLAQLARIETLLARRKQVESWYLEQMRTFEGIKPPYLGQDVDEVHWMLYVVHLGARFTASGRRQIIDDLAADHIEAAAYCLPLHQQFHYQQLGMARGQLALTERIGDRSLALPLHAGLDEDQVRFIVKTLKDASVNVGAGAAIYL
ncbi:MAG: aminotransferase class I/II-fold pyridoxal phosphate-dependent enzyme [Thiomonas sp.]|uniref:DegT/DnrJ/EryC1/StrS family aminotransferase n=1 Tax=Thiomonas sp. TaxID=2047785 RepID=UPI002A35FFAD|nr:aminotransferase class I/II-fold pyridoxal phosphate-dependent enzyme [Thiomonas sp.]MDY0329803.1 aminotransferase class I/II-fold pyridoxal phosphate-dependent enzyme [Thiomonas sp.]